MQQFDPHELTGERVRHLYKRRGSAWLFNAVTGALVALLLSTASARLALLWYAAFLAVQGWQWHMGRPNADQSSIAVPIESIKAHVVAAALAGLGWGSASLALPSLSAQYVPMLLVFIVLAAVIVLPRMAAVPAVYAGYAAGAFVPMLAAALMLRDVDRTMVLALVLVVSAMLWVSARSVEADLMDVILRRLALERMAGEDKLTGLNNRRRFDTVLEAEWRRAERLGVPVSLMLLDVDHFKKFNDHYGHTAGDECLAQVASALQGQIKRAGDMVARYGGEEFVVLLFHTSMAEARAMGERLCQAVQALRMPHEISSHGVVTVSIGGATVVPAVGMAPKQLLDAADEVLYRAKESGRNQVCWSNALLQTAAAASS